MKSRRLVDLVKVLLRLGEDPRTVDDLIPYDVAELVVEELGGTCHPLGDGGEELDVRARPPPTPTELAEAPPRSPVVTILGHVNHGKTSLLDRLRGTSVAAQEPGGITQHIGAFTVAMDDGEAATFIDTPGHSAFSDMRSRGAHATDIAVLVVAANDGIQPQTVEAINHARAAQVPLIVAVNKIDLPGDLSSIKSALRTNDVLLEEDGGDVQLVQLCALDGRGIDDLLGAIRLQSDLLDLRSLSSGPAEGVVLESRQGRGLGAVTSVIVRRGTLSPGNAILAGTAWGTARVLRDERGKQLKTVLPGQLVEISGWRSLPQAGNVLLTLPTEARAKSVASWRTSHAAKRSARQQPAEEIESGVKELPLVVKADSVGTLEALLAELDALPCKDEVIAKVLHSAVGPVSEGDVSLAAASDAVVVGFGVKAPGSVATKARTFHVPMQCNNVIYRVLEDIQERLGALLPPEPFVDVTGTATVLQLFPLGKSGVVAGCKVTTGMLEMGDKCRVVRNDSVISQGEIVSLRRFKDEVKQVEKNTECGVVLGGVDGLEKGDGLEGIKEGMRARILK